MSAIAGEVNYKDCLSRKIEVYEQMKKSLSKRGNDDQSSYVSNELALIQNLTCVDNISIEPLPYLYSDKSNKLMITLDGVLFNRNEVKEMINRKGMEVEFGHDFELIVKGFICYGKEILEILNGVYAFAIWDFNKSELFFARDRLGVKPFFYMSNKDSFVFASEIKGLLESGETEPIIDFNSIMEIMLIGPGRTLGYGVFKNISELKPAHYGIFSKEGLHIERYWDLTAEEHKESFESTVEKVRFLVTDSIERQIEGDLQVCTMLSGGLDSSIITAVANRVLSQQSQKLKTFSVTYRGNDKYFKRSKFQPNSDTMYINLMKESLGIENELIEIESEELADALFDAVDARDLPGMADVDASLLLFSRKIREQFKIAVSGECSDELFGGYPWYRDPELDNPKGFPWAHSDKYRKSLINKDILKDFDTDKYIYDKYITTVNSTSLLSDTDKDKRKKELTRLNIDWFMMTLVDRTDRMCASCSLDVRVPFCDYKIAQYLYNVPWEYKDYNGYEKGLLREAFKDYLPDEVLWRKKSPYPKTHNPEYLRIVRERLKMLIKDADSPMFSFVSREKLAELLCDEIPQNFYGQLMTTAQTVAYFLQIDYWLKKYNIKIEL